METLSKCVKPQENVYSLFRGVTQVAWLLWFSNEKYEKTKINKSLFCQLIIFDLHNRPNQIGLFTTGLSATYTNKSNP